MVNFGDLTNDNRFIAPVVGLGIAYLLHRAINKTSSEEGSSSQKTTIAKKVDFTNAAIVITGASKGFGRAVALEFAKGLKPKYMVLVARSQTGLAKTKADITKLKDGSLTDDDIKTVVTDLGDVMSAASWKKSILSTIPSSCDQVVLINNAGTIGDLSKKIADIDSLGEIFDYTKLNLSSCMYLTSMFMRQFPEKKKTVVNISSLLAIQGFPGWGMYATIKAARDMMHKVLAAESEQSRVLNYAPGPLDTDMQKEVRETICMPDQKEYFTKMKTDNTLVKAGDSASKLVKLLLEDEFESGAHIDYYDV